MEITSYDELHLDKLGDELSALFIIISDTDATFNFLVAIMYSQLFNLLCTKADNSPGGKLDYHVRCLLDEFANIGEIPQFEKLIATIRSREISASIILQANLAKLRLDHAEAQKIVAEPFPQQEELDTKEQRLKVVTDELNQAAIEAKKNAPKREKTCYFERAKMKRDAARLGKKPKTPKDQTKGRSKKQGIE